MATVQVPVSLAEYMNTDYEPDCEYVDGILEDRNVGHLKHSHTQSLLLVWLAVKGKLQGLIVLSEQRVRISPSRVRIPDVCLIPSDDKAEVTQQPPPLWVEILSPEDRWSRIQAKLREVQAFGVPAVWIIDPYAREAWVALDGGAAAQVEDGILRCPNLQLEVPLDEILAE